MFELVEIPELQELQRKAARLEKERTRAENRWQALNQQAQRVRDEDVVREAEALHRGEEPPEPQEPEVRENLEAASRELRILQQRCVLAEGEVSKYVSEHAYEIAETIRETYQHQGDVVAELAQRLSIELARLWALEQDHRKVGRYMPQPSTEHQPAQKFTAFFGNVVNTRNVMQDSIGGVPKGTLQQALDALAELRASEAESSPTEQQVTAGAGHVIEVAGSSRPIEVIDD